MKTNQNLKQNQNNWRTFYCNILLEISLGCTFSRDDNFIKEKYGKKKLTNKPKKHETKKNDDISLLFLVR